MLRTAPQQPWRAFAAAHGLLHPPVRLPALHALLSRRARAASAYAARCLSGRLPRVRLGEPVGKATRALAHAHARWGRHAAPALLVLALLLVLGVALLCLCCARVARVRAQAAAAREERRRMRLEKARSVLGTT